MKYIKILEFVMAANCCSSLTPVIPNLREAIIISKIHFLESRAVEA